MLVSGRKGWGKHWVAVQKNKSTHSRLCTRSLLLKRHLTQLQDERFSTSWWNIFIDIIDGFLRKKIITGASRVSETMSLTGEQNRCNADKNWTHLYLFSLKPLKIAPRQPATPLNICSRRRQSRMSSVATRQYLPPFYCMFSSRSVSL